MCPKLKSDFGQDEVYIDRPEKYHVEHDGYHSRGRNGRNYRNHHERDQAAQCNKEDNGQVNSVGCRDPPQSYVAAEEPQALQVQQQSQPLLVESQNRSALCNGYLN
ncbi:hypothetical protein QAD02_021803 [Eretmocerus hayati]|uniref:Uncharacterized protein n=1 Tax=Eretmocerus hayati TaxID=131215 RepID=A0ACC2PW27_9HYME|nr:hypothetical protein QAD02_021803 [Eretmocerus hayati]